MQQSLRLKMMVISIGIIFSGLQLFGQNKPVEFHWGCTSGLTFNLGSKVKRLGLRGGFYVYRDFIQLNVQIAGHYHFNGWGPDLKGKEWQMSTGILGSWGKVETETNNPFIQAVGNQTQRPYSITYAYKWYFDEILTSQQTGIIAIGLRNFTIISENDALIGDGTDKFRTGTILVQYRHKNTIISLNNTMWTGDAKYHKTKRIKGTEYPARFGYFDLSRALYADCSHGILALQVQQYLVYQQNARFSMGIDAEQIRHFLQNKTIHDMPFVPKRWNKAENAHYPMLDTKGKPYLFQKGQKIRPIRFFWELSLNPSLFY